MGVLDVIGGLAKTAGAGFNAYGVDKRLRVKDALDQAKADREAARDAVLNRVALGGIDPDLQGKIAGARASAEVPAAVDRAKQLAPISVDTATKTAQSIAPINIDTATKTHAAERTFDNANPAPVQPSYSFPVVTDANGKQVVGIGNNKTGEIRPSDTLAKATGSAAKLTGDQEKSYLFYNLMKNAEPEISATLASGKIRPAAVSAYLGAGSASEIPLVGKAIGMVAKPAANANLNEDEQKLIRAGKDFTAGVLRKESGAAVTASELMETMERYFPGMFGDKPGLTDAKSLARQQYMKTMEQEAGPAINFYGHQKTGTPQAGASPGSGHEGLSDDEFAAQWKAGKRQWP